MQEEMLHVFLESRNCYMESTYGYCDASLTLLKMLTLQITMVMISNSETLAKLFCNTLNLVSFFFLLDQIIKPFSQETDDARTSLTAQNPGGFFSTVKTL